MMKIKLIAPLGQCEDTLSGSFKLQRVNLPLLAALTPPGHAVTIVDETFAPDDTNQAVDLVGITVMTDLVLRAYDIADTYRRKAVKVVMGGIHPTVLPGDAFPRNQRMPGFLQTLARIPPLCYENERLRASTASVDKMAALRYVAVIGIFAAVVFVLGIMITTWSNKAT